MGGDSPLLAHFREACGDRIRFQLLAYPGWRDVLPGDGDVEALVTDFVHTIEASSPAGPVALAGYSMGAALAYAIAQRLEAGGRAVRFVGMIDGEARPYAKDVFRPRRIGLVRRVYWVGAKFVGAAQRGEALDLLAMVGVTALMRQEHHGKLRLLARLPARPCPRVLRHTLRRYLTEATQIRLVEPWAAAQAQTSARPLAAPVVLFRSDDYPETVPEDLGWGPLCANLRIIHVPGGHESTLAAAHATFLAELEATASTDRYAVIAPSTGSATPEM